MAKLIGTGKDPRMPEGVDYDVLDEDAEAHVRAGLGEGPVDAATERHLIHRSQERIIAHDPASGVGRAPDVRGGYVSNAAARIDKTALDQDAVDAAMPPPEGAVEAQEIGSERDPGRLEARGLGEPEATRRAEQERLDAEERERQAQAEREQQVPGEDAAGSTPAGVADQPGFGDQEASETQPAGVEAPEGEPERDPQDREG